MFYVSLNNFSLIWRRHHCRRRAAKSRPMLDTQGHCAGRDRATPAVTQGLSFSGLIRRTTPFSRLLQHTKGCLGSILTRILTGTRLIRWRRNLHISILLIQFCRSISSCDVSLKIGSAMAVDGVPSTCESGGVLEVRVGRSSSLVSRVEMISVGSD